MISVGMHLLFFLPRMAILYVLSLIVSTAFQPTFGKLYKVFNVKWLFLIAVGIFESSSLFALILICSWLIDMRPCTDFGFSHCWPCNCGFWRSSTIPVAPFILIIRAFFLVCSQLSLTLFLFKRDPCFLRVSPQSLPLLQSQDLLPEAPSHNMFLGVGGKDIPTYIGSH